MKRFLIFLVSALLIFSLSSCTKKQNETSQNPEETNSTFDNLLDKFGVKKGYETPIIRF